MKIDYCRFCKHHAKWILRETRTAGNHLGRTDGIARTNDVLVVRRGPATPRWPGTTLPSLLPW